MNSVLGSVFGLGVSLALMLISLPAQAYSMKTTDDGAIVRWFRPAVRISVGSSLTKRIPYEQARAAAIMASEAWRGLPGVPDIEVGHGGSNPFDHEVRNFAIHLDEAWPLDPRQAAVTYTSYLPTGEIVGVDIVLNGGMEFAVLDDDADDAGEARLDLVAVLTHEMGHLLGLDEEYDHESATMWPYIAPGDTHQRTLSADDEEGVIDIYRTPLPTAGGCSVVMGLPAHKTSAAIPLALAMLIAFRRRMRFGCGR